MPENKNIQSSRARVGTTASARQHATVASARTSLHELLEAVLVELLVLHVEVLVLLHVRLVLENVATAAAIAVKVGRLLIAKRAVLCVAIFLTAKPG